MKAAATCLKRHMVSNPVSTVHGAGEHHFVTKVIIQYLYINYADFYVERKKLKVDFIRSKSSGSDPCCFRMSDPDPIQVVFRRSDPDPIRVVFRRSDSDPILVVFQRSDPQPCSCVHIPVHKFVKAEKCWLNMNMPMFV